MSITVELNGAVASWTPTGGFTGDPLLVSAAHEAVRGHYDVEWGLLPDRLIASDDTDLGALSALMYLDPHHTRILDWPDAVRDWWQANTETCEPGL